MIGGISYVTRAKFESIKQEISYMEGDGQVLLAKLLASSPSSGMGRPHDLPAHQIAAEFRGHLQELKNIVSISRIIDDLLDQLPDHSKVSIGLTVRLLFIGEDESVEYTILGQHEANPERGIISCFSPIGDALLGRRIGELVTVKLNTSGREIQLKILDITQKPLDFIYPATGWKLRLEGMV